MTAQSKKKNKRNKKGQEEGGKRETASTSPPRQEEWKLNDVPTEAPQEEVTPVVTVPEVEAAVEPPVEKKQKKRKETVS